MSIKISKEINNNIELILIEYLNNNNYLDFKTYNYLEQKIYYKKGKINESI